MSLAPDCYSDRLRETGEDLSVHVAYETAAEILQRLLGIARSPRVLKATLTEDATEVEASYAPLPPPSPAREAEIVVIQADGQGVPLVRETPAAPPVRLGKGENRARTKEAVVTSVSTMAPAPRTPEAVVASFFHQAEPAPSAAPHPEPQHKPLWATLAGKDAALTAETTSR